MGRAGCHDRRLAFMQRRTGRGLRCSWSMLMRKRRDTVLASLVLTANGQSALDVRAAFEDARSRPSERI